MDEATRKKIIDAVDAEADALRKIALDIHANPELGLEEHKAAGWLSGFLSGKGFDVERPTAGLETAFRATAGEGRPLVAFMSEYDALPEIGHGCGHNLIAIMGVAAGVGLKAVIAELGGGGTVQVLGTPGEEGMGGKVTMVSEGVFDEVDFAMMIHPSSQNRSSSGGTAVKQVHIAFRGRTSHAAGAPEKGINALDAVLLTFTGINALRQHIKEDSRIHGVIKHGGVKPNIVPDFADAAFYVRSPDDDYLPELIEKVENVARGAALMTGATLEFDTTGTAYRSGRPCPVLGRLYQEEAERFGLEFNPDPKPARGSSDFGDVSWVVPAIHSYCGIAPKTVNLHSAEFAAAAGTDEAVETALIAAKAMALAAARIVEDASLLSEIKAEFAERMRPREDGEESG